MRRVATTALALLMIANLFTAYAIVPAIIAGAVLIGSGIGIGLWLGHGWWGKPAEDKIKELEQQLTNEKLENLATLESASLNAWGKSKIIVYDLGDAVHYGRNYAWALAKYEIIKALEQGDSLDAAASKARIAVFKYYLNVTKNVIEEVNNTAEYLNFTLNKYAEDRIDIKALIDSLRVSCFVYAEGDFKRHGAGMVGKNFTIYTPNGKVYLIWRKPYIHTQPVHVTVIGQKFTVLKLCPNLIIHRARLINYAFSFVDPNGHATIVYDWKVYQQVLNQINKEYKAIIGNLNAYVNRLKGAKFNTTDLIDPYVLATFLDKDWNKTGYYGYAAAELALLGLNTAGLNKTVTIEYKVRG